MVETVGMLRAIGDGFFDYAWDDGTGELLCQ